MITKMKKYTFLVVASAYDAFLTQLREAGVVHVTMKAEGMAEDAELQASMRRKEEIVHILNQGAPDQLIQEKEQVLVKIENVKREIKRMEIWGDFSSEKLAELRDAGYTIYYYTCPAKRFEEEWGIRVAEQNGQVYFITINNKIDNEFCAEQTLNEKCAADLQKDIEALNGLLVAAEVRIDAWAKAHIHELEAELKTLQQQIDWQRVTLSTDTMAEGTLRLLEGYCPTENSEALDKMLEKQSVYYVAEDPQETDDTPIQLKNNFYSRLFEPITRLYSLPNYMELDPTPFFAPFFMLFFGLCLGDGGYGLLIVLAGLALIRKWPSMKEWGWLAIFMGVTTMIVGILTGMFFGINLEEVAFLKPVKDYFITETNSTVHIAGGSYHPMMAFSIAIGIFQILFAMGFKVVRITLQKGFKYAVYDCAWLIFLVTSIVWLILMDSLSVGGTYAIYTILALCAVCILFYSNPDRKILLLNIGGGLWGTYNMISGLMGDILSYIRLFALGLAGGILGNVFNTLALQVGSACPAWIGWLPMIFIMIFGHGLNFALCLISSIVHPLRLTFVEFYKNAGFEGGGKEYTPFKK